MNVLRHLNINLKGLCHEENQIIYIFEKPLQIISYEKWHATMVKVKLINSESDIIVSMYRFVIYFDKSIFCQFSVN